ncbi:MAG: hypothetical protein ACE5HS_09495 [bacterium]
MTNFLTKLFVVAGVLVISTIIFLLMSENQALKEDILNRSLRLLGEQFILLVPAPQDKSMVYKKWQDFTEKVRKGQVPTQKVERVAVSILNASNLNKNFSREDAETILQLAFNESPIIPLEASAPIIVHSASRTVNGEHKMNTADESDAKTSTVVMNQSDGNLEIRLEKLGEELETVYAFNQKVKESCAADTSYRRVFMQNMRYQLDDGIRIKADVVLKKKLQNEGTQKLYERLADLEKKKLIEWDADFSTKLILQRQKTRYKLDSLKMLLSLQQIQNGDTLKITINDPQTEKTLRALEKLHDWHVIKAEEIEKIVMKNLHKTDKKSNTN